MNFNLIVSIFAFIITGNNVVRANWDSTYQFIRPHFATFLQSYRDTRLTLSQNPNLFWRYDPASGWMNTTTSQNFTNNTRGSITILTQFFKQYKTSNGVSAVKAAVRLLCRRINSDGNIDSEFKYLGIPLREHLIKRIYEDGFGETSMQLDQDCPLGPPDAHNPPKAQKPPKGQNPTPEALKLTTPRNPNFIRSTVSS